MNKLEKIIADAIAEKGPITFDRFMDLVLYHPVYGYYSSGVKRIGREGDFYTSSHLHPVFGSMVARQLCEMWEFLGRPDDFTVLEMGAGEGYVCRDALDYLIRDTGSGETAAAGLFRSIRYVIVEKSPYQRTRQQERLSAYREKVTWLSDIREAMPFTGCVFSNELLDAFPVHQVRMEDELKEIYVTHNGGTFAEVSGPLSSDALERHFLDFAPHLDRGYMTEANLRISNWLRDIERVMKNGFVFTIDYGYPAEEYYSEDRNRGTLMCYWKHQLSEDPYLHIGEQDITAHVNFSALKRYGDEAGFRGIGYCNQGTFLVAAGIDQEIGRIAEVSDDYLFELARIKKLFMPQGLGDSHKVMIQYKGEGYPKLRGFSMRNQLRLL